MIQRIVRLFEGRKCVIGVYIRIADATVPFMLVRVNRTGRPPFPMRRSDCLLALRANLLMIKIIHHRRGIACPLVLRQYEMPTILADILVIKGVILIRLIGFILMDLCGRPSAGAGEQMARPISL